MVSGRGRRLGSDKNHTVVAVRSALWSGDVKVVSLWISYYYKQKKKKKIVQGSRDGSAKMHANKGKDDSSTKVIPTFFDPEIPK